MKPRRQLPLVSVSRRDFDEFPLDGFLVGQSDQLLVLHSVCDSLSLDGYRALRRADITELIESSERHDLIERALRLKEQAPVRPQQLDLSNMRTLAASAQSHYGALVINREIVCPDEAEVGTIRMTSDSSYVLRWLTPNAKWEDDDRPFLYDDITMLEFDGEYERTLVAVAADREKGTS